jgi:hypothetical protein
VPLLATSSNGATYVSAFLSRGLCLPCSLLIMSAHICMASFCCIYMVPSTAYTSSASICTALLMASACSSSEGPYLMRVHG